MAKSKTVNLKKVLKKRLDKAWTKTLSKRNMKSYMRELARTIRSRTRLGNFAEKDQGKKKKLKKLKPSTVRNRKNMKRRGELSDLTKPSRSNLTMTGQMLDALTGFGLRVAVGVVKVKSTARKDSRIKNDKVAGYVSDQGRPFLNITSKESKELAQNIKRDLVKLLRKK